MDIVIKKRDVIGLQMDLKKLKNESDDNTNIKQHYKMYKAGKKWLFASVTMVTFGAMGFMGPKANADVVNNSNSNNGNNSSTTTDSNSTTLGNQSATTVTTSSSINNNTDISSSNNSSNSVDFSKTSQSTDSNNNDSSAVSAKSTDVTNSVAATNTSSDSSTSSVHSSDTSSNSSNSSSSSSTKSSVSSSDSQTSHQIDVLNQLKSSNIDSSNETSSSSTNSSTSSTNNSNNSASDSSNDLQISSSNNISTDLTANDISIRAFSLDDDGSTDTSVTPDKSAGVETPAQSIAYSAIDSVYSRISHNAANLNSVSQSFATNADSTSSSYSSVKSDLISYASVANSLANSASTVRDSTLNSAKSTTYLASEASILNDGISNLSTIDTSVFDIQSKFDKELLSFNNSSTTGGDKLNIDPTSIPVPDNGYQFGFDANNIVARRSFDSATLYADKNQNILIANGSIGGISDLGSISGRSLQFANVQDTGRGSNGGGDNNNMGQGPSPIGNFKYVDATGLDFGAGVALDTETFNGSSTTLEYLNLGKNITTQIKSVGFLMSPGQAVLHFDGITSLKVIMTPTGYVSSVNLTANGGTGVRASNGGYDYTAGNSASNQDMAGVLHDAWANSFSIAGLSNVPQSTATSVYINNGNSDAAALDKTSAASIAVSNTQSYATMYSNDGINSNVQVTQSASSTVNSLSQAASSMVSQMQAINNSIYANGGDNYNYSSASNVLTSINNDISNAVTRLSSDKDSPDNASNLSDATQATSLASVATSKAAIGDKVVASILSGWNDKNTQLSSMLSILDGYASTASAAMTSASSASSNARSLAASIANSIGSFATSQANSMNDSIQAMGQSLSSMNSNVNSQSSALANNNSVVSDWASYVHTIFSNHSDLPNGSSQVSIVDSNSSVVSQMADILNSNYAIVSNTYNSMSSAQVVAASATSTANSLYAIVSSAASSLDVNKASSGAVIDESMATSVANQFLTIDGLLGSAQAANDIVNSAANTIRDKTHTNQIVTTSMQSGANSADSQQISLATSAVNSDAAVVSGVNSTMPITQSQGSVWASDANSIAQVHTANSAVQSNTIVTKSMASIIAVKTSDAIVMASVITSASNVVATNQTSMNSLQVIANSANSYANDAGNQGQPLMASSATSIAQSALGIADSLAANSRLQMSLANSANQRANQDVIDAQSAMVTMHSGVAGTQSAADLEDNSIAVSGQVTASNAASVTQSVVDKMGNNASHASAWTSDASVVASLYPNDHAIQSTMSDVSSLNSAVISAESDAKLMNSIAAQQKAFTASQVAQLTSLVANNSLASSAANSLMSNYDIPNTDKLVQNGQLIVSVADSLASTAAQAASVASAAQSKALDDVKYGKSAMASLASGAQWIHQTVISRNSSAVGSNVIQTSSAASLTASNTAQVHISSSFGSDWSNAASSVGSIHNQNSAIALNNSFVSSNHVNLSSADAVAVQMQSLASSAKVTMQSVSDLTSNLASGASQTSQSLTSAFNNDDYNAVDSDMANTQSVAYQTYSLASVGSVQHSIAMSANDNVLAASKVASGAVNGINSGVTVVHNLANIEDDDNISRDNSLVNSNAQATSFATSTASVNASYAIQWNASANSLLASHSNNSSVVTMVSQVASNNAIVTSAASDAQLMSSIASNATSVANSTNTAMNQIMSLATLNSSAASQAVINGDSNKASMAVSAGQSMVSQADSLSQIISGQLSLASSANVKAQNDVKQAQSATTDINNSLHAAQNLAISDDSNTVKLVVSSTSSMVTSMSDTSTQVSSWASSNASQQSNATMLMSSMAQNVSYYPDYSSASSANINLSSAVSGFSLASSNAVVYQKVAQQNYNQAIDLAAQAATLQSQGYDASSAALSAVDKGDFSGANQFATSAQAYVSQADTLRYQASSAYAAASTAQSQMSSSTNLASSYSQVISSAYGIILKASQNKVVPASSSATPSSSTSDTPKSSSAATPTKYKAPTKKPIIKRLIKINKAVKLHVNGKTKQLQVKNKPVLKLVGKTKLANGKIRQTVVYQGKRGYIVTNPKTTPLAYYQTSDVNKLNTNTTKFKVQVKGHNVLEHINKSFGGSYTKVFKPNTIVTVSKVVKYKGITRFKMSNGHYLTSNKYWVKMIPTK